MVNLSHSASSTPTGITTDETGVGRRLRELRTARGLSIRTLAEKSGLNVNTLSLIENQRTSPSVSTLQQLAQTLQIPISKFFDTEQGDKQIAYQKDKSRPQISFTHGTIEDLGAGLPHFGLEPLVVTLAPRADSGPNPIVHTGREFVYCLEGHLTYIVNGEPHCLEAGDSLFFEAYLPHCWKNESDLPSRNLLVLCPIDERDRSAERHFIK